MAVPTLLTSGQASPGTSSWSTASFTPSDGALLVVGVMVVDNGGGSIGGNLTIADSLSPDLTYTNWLTLAEAGGFQPQGKFYTAPVDTGTSMTITFDCGASNALSSVWAVLEFAAGDFFDILPVWSVGSNNALPNNTAASITLGNPARATDCIVAMFQTDGSSSGTIAVTPGSGWSELAEMGTTGTQTLGEIEYLVGVSNTADWVDTQTGSMGVFASGGMAIVIRDAAEADDVIVTIGQGAQVTGTTTATPTYPAGYTAVADDLAVVWLTEKIADTGEFTTPTNWTKDGTRLNEVGAQDLRGTVYYKKLTASEALPAWTGDTADNLSVQCSIFRGVDTTTAIDAVTVMSESDAADQFTPTSSTATVTANAKCLSLVATSDDNALTMVTTQSFVGLFSGLSFDNTTGSDISAGGACKQIAAATTVVTAPTWDQTVNGTDQWVAAMVLLRPASTGTNAAAGNAAATGAAANATTAVAPSAGHSSATGAAGAVTAKVNPSAGNASATGAAADATTNVAPSAGNAAASGAAFDATVSTDEPVTDAPAELASATGTAHNPQPSVAPSAGNAAASGAAHDATTSVAPTSGHAAATGAAANAQVSVAPSAGHASAAGSAADATTKVAPTPATATATGQAFDATAQTGSAVNAPAGNAAATSTAHNPTVSIAPSAEHASATGAANDPTVSIQPAAGNAAATAAAFDASVAIAVSAGAAFATAVAFVIGAKISPTAGHASATGVANDATSSIPAIILIGRVDVWREPLPVVYSELGSGSWRETVLTVGTEPEEDDWREPVPRIGGDL